MSEMNILVLDFGGGKLDVSIIAIDSGVFQVIGTSGNTSLGGTDIDNNMVQHFLQEFRRKWNIDVSTDKMCIVRLKEACEKAKCALSTSEEVSIEISAFAGGKDFSTKITRQEFEELSYIFSGRVLYYVEQVLKDCRLQKEQINEIVLVGGSTRIPEIQQILKRYFDKEVNTSLNSDEASAYGATVLDAIIHKADDSQLKTLVALEVAPLSISFETLTGTCHSIVPRNTLVPSTHSMVFGTLIGIGNNITINIFQGDREFNTYNFLSELTLVDVSADDSGLAIIDITFDLDVNNFLKIHVKDVNGNAIKTIANKSFISYNEMKHMEEYGKTYKKTIHETTERLKTLLKGYNAWLADDPDNEKMFSDEELSLIESVCQQMMEWLMGPCNVTQTEYEMISDDMAELLATFEKRIQSIDLPSSEG